jgi:thiol-disulfide isomerase/thioredoxin
VSGFVKYIKSNIGFIISLIFLAVIALSPTAKVFLMRGLIKTALFAPSFNDKQRKNRLAPQMSYTSLDGKNFDLESLKGKVVFINFWATWCPPCIAEMPSIDALNDKTRSNPNVVFLMIDVDNELTKSEDFMKKNNYNLPIYAPVGSIPQELFKGSLPTTVVVNKKGEIVFFNEGMADYNSGKTEKLLNTLSK